MRRILPFMMIAFLISCSNQQTESSATTEQDENQVLSIKEQRALLTDLEECQSPRTCPHGRPTMIHLSVDLLERQFGRRGAR